MGANTLGLGRLQPVPLREVWRHEAHDFTPWLANNLDRLAVSVQAGPLKLIGTEESVGPFSIDILAETIDGEIVVIENQLEVSDHRHLGQIVTYASGVGASIVIWVLERLQEEHRAAIGWLNEHTDERTSFFAVEVGVVKIGDSIPAPVFDVVARPNDWQKRARSRASATNWRGWEMLEAALHAVPVGQWVSIGDLAKIVGTTAGWIGRRLATNIDQYLGTLHRMANADGSPWQHYRSAPEQTEGDPNMARRLLESEGVDFVDGVASPNDQVTLDELQALLADAQT